MKLIDKIQRDIDDIATFGYCDFSATFKTLIEAKHRILELEKLSIGLLKKELLEFLEAHNDFDLDEPEAVVGIYLDIYKNKEVCNRINDNNTNRCITCGVKAGNPCGLKQKAFKL